MPHNPVYHHRREAQRTILYTRDGDIDWLHRAERRTTELRYTQVHRVLSRKRFHTLLREYACNATIQYECLQCAVHTAVDLIQSIITLNLTRVVVASAGPLNIVWVPKLIRVR